MGIVLADDRKAGSKKTSIRQDGRSEKPANDMAFDSWLMHHLGRLYDPVVRAPLPETLIRLIDRK